MTAMLTHVDFEPLWRCEYLCGEPEHPCGRPAIASAISPNGDRTALCERHERTALAAVSLPSWADWTVEERVA